ncbi:MAG: hypothetical protein HS111_21610 [Kofleriaceae bacterium]|nr:hypothetical protein [Kofleriaceae bacterium]
MVAAPGGGVPSAPPTALYTSRPTLASRAARFVVDARAPAAEDAVVAAARRWRPPAATR